MRTTRPTLRENSSSPSTWRMTTLARRNPPEMANTETLSLQSGFSEGGKIPHGQRRRRFGSASCFLSASQPQANNKKRRGSMGKARPNVIRFRSSSVGSLQLDSPSAIPDLTGSSSSSMDEYCGGSSPASFPPTSPSHPHKANGIVHEKASDLELKHLVKRWTRSLLLIVSQTTRTTTSLAFNGLLDILFWVLSTLFAIIENTAVLIQENQFLKWIGNSLIRISAVVIHSTSRRKQPVHRQHSQQPSRRKNSSASPSDARRRPRQLDSTSRNCSGDSSKRRGEPVKRGLFRRKAPSEAL